MSIMVMRRFFSGLMCLVLLCAAVPAFAQVSHTIVGARTIEAYYSNQEQKFTLNYYTRDKSPVTFTITDTVGRIRISAKGQLVIPAFFAGSATLEVTSEATEEYLETTLYVPILVYPNAPVITLKQSGTESVKVSWKKVPKVTSYTLQVSRYSSMKNAKAYYIQPSDTSFTVEDLTPGKTYYFRLTSEAGLYAYTESAKKSIKLKEEVAVKSFTLVQSGKETSLNGKTVNLRVGKTLKLGILNLLPKTASNKGIYFWSTKNSVATVSSSGEITALTRGSAKIWAAARDGYGASAYLTVNVK